ncbi:MAG: hypothetical protein OXB88_08245, partial [Bacteriovoracales bacterium]|nr:hypothetical protein [Bacteriovoracales bacterium]
MGKRTQVVVFSTRKAIIVSWGNFVKIVLTLFLFFSFSTLPKTQIAWGSSGECSTLDNQVDLKRICEAKVRYEKAEGDLEAAQRSYEIEKKKADERAKDTEEIISESDIAVSKKEREELIQERDKKIESLGQAREAQERENAKRELRQIMARIKEKESEIKRREDRLKALVEGMNSTLTDAEQSLERAKREKEEAREALSNAEKKVDYGGDCDDCAEGILQSITSGNSSLAHIAIISEFAQFSSLFGALKKDLEGYIGEDPKAWGREGKDLFSRVRKILWGDADEGGEGLVAYYQDLLEKIEEKERSNENDEQLSVLKGLKGEIEQFLSFVSEHFNP